MQVTRILRNRFQPVVFALFKLRGKCEMSPNVSSLTHLKNDEAEV